MFVPQKYTVISNKKNFFNTFVLIVCVHFFFERRSALGIVEAAVRQVLAPKRSEAS